MTLHQQLTHPEYVEGCFGCKASSVSFGTVPGGARDSRNQVSAFRQREKDLHRYREKRRAGEQPDGTTRDAMEKYEKRVHSWQKSEKKLRDDNPKPVVDQLQAKTLNKE